MILFIKHSSHHIGLSLGIVGIVLSLLGFTGTDSRASEPDTRTNQVQTRPAAHNSHKANAEAQSKPHYWTVLCQREDGTQGVFKVTSTVAEKEPAGAPEPSPQVKEPSKNAQSADDMGIENSTEQNPDPFEDTTLKCGRLLTLLAIFATADSQTP